MKLSAKMTCLVPALLRIPITAFTFAILVTGLASMSTAATAAEGCDPPCPKGQVCAFKNARGGNGETVCKTPITIDCPNNDPLCGLKKPKGPSSLRVR
ncbi:hypothetical protein ACQR16_17890 [Bradyrhizobium oligotrophicum]|uniref:hypothetical protein n=1 Tax=Bradyrhizobium oligotrophicum TaxID=44255 RepID=UPI003EBC3E9E